VRPYLTWRPGRKWCEKCGRYRVPHVHVSLVADTSAFTEAMERANAAMERVLNHVRAPMDGSSEGYAAALERVRKLSAPTVPARASMAALGIVVPEESDTPE
jgi:hypothetical protein